MPRTTATPKLATAVSKLQMAASYAEDGAILTAIQRAQEAVIILRLERDRRISIGLLPPQTEDT